MPNAECWKKFTEWLTLCTCDNDKRCRSKTLSSHENTFNQSLMISIGVSKLHYTGLTFVDPGVMVNEICYCDVLLSQQLLPARRQVSGEFIFQQECTEHVSLLTLIFHKVMQLHALGAVGYLAIALLQISRWVCRQVFKIGKKLLKIWKKCDDSFFDSPYTLTLYKKG